MKSQGRFTHKVLDWLTDWLYFISTSLIVSYSSERLSNQITMTPAEELLIRWLSCCLPVQVQAPHLSYGTVDFLLLQANIIANNSAHTVGIELRKYRVQIEERSPRFNNEGDVLSAEKQQWVESAEFQWWSDCTKNSCVCRRRNKTGTETNARWLAACLCDILYCTVSLYNLNIVTQQCYRVSLICSTPIHQFVCYIPFYLPLLCHYFCDPFFTISPILDH